jgi:hypothetical protein
MAGSEEIPCIAFDVRNNERLRVEFEGQKLNES